MNDASVQQTYNNTISTTHRSSRGIACQKPRNIIQYDYSFTSYCSHTTIKSKSNQNKAIYQIEFGVLLLFLLMQFQSFLFTFSADLF